MNAADEETAVLARRAETSARRQGGIDALRAGVTLLVILHHTAITYGAIGGWFYRERSPDGSASAKLLILFCTINQAWFMGLFFLLAGYFTPAALRHKGPLRFMADRLLRLGLPLMVFGWLLGPATIALAQTAKGRPFFETLGALWQDGVFEPGPLWFAKALLLFALASALWWVLVAARRRAASATELMSPRPFPSNLALTSAALGTGAVAFGLRLVWPVGQELWGLQLGYFAGYALLFAFGCLAAAPRWLERLPAATVQTWKRIAWLSLPVLPVVALLGPIVPALRGPAQGGWTVPAVVYAFWEPLVAWGVIMGLLHACQSRFADLGEVGQRLARRAYAIYVIHPPVLVAVSLAWRHAEAPALVKFGVSGGLTCGLCYLLAGLLLRVPGAKQVL